MTFRVPKALKEQIAELSELTGIDQAKLFRRALKRMCSDDRLKKMAELAREAGWED